MNKSNLGKKTLIKPVVLLGMMGAGKTSVGRALSRLLDAPFFDVDAEIEAASGQSVSSIFSEYGEEEFRRRERQTIARLLKDEFCVISLGGGAFINDETRARIKESALSVWLKVDEEVLLKRVSRNGGAGRPVFAGSHLPDKMRELLNAREPIYAEADLIVPCDDRPVIKTAQKVKDEVEAFMER